MAMLSKNEIDALLQNPKPIVRMANDQDRKLIDDYINAHPNQVSDEMRAFVAQIAHCDIQVTDDTDTYIAFSGQLRVHEQLNDYQLNDSWFLTIPKEERF